MQIKIDDSAYSSAFHDVLHSWDRYIIAYGGRGAGKSDVFYLKYLVELFEPYYFKLAYINKEQSNIRDQQYAGFKRVAKQIGVFDKLKFYDGDYRIINPKNGNSLIPKGMDDPEKTKGLDNVTAIWWDEINKGTLADFRALNELLRSPESTYLQFAISFNPVHENHWLRHNFFSEDNPHEVHPNYKADTLVHHSTYLDNEFINQEAYFQTLLKSSSGSSNVMRVNVLGDWGQSEPVENPFLDEFNEEVHISKEIIEYNTNIPLYLSIDFNRNPFCALLFQIDTNGKAMRINVIEEISIMNGNINKMCNAIDRLLENNSFSKGRLKITGDAMGNRGELSQRDNASNYLIMQRELRLSHTQIVVPSNPFHKNSRSDCNAALRKLEIRISPKCTGFISDCTSVACDSTGSIIKSNRKKEEQRADFLDCFRYFVNTYLKRHL